MALSKQAQILSVAQEQQVINYLKTTRHSLRNQLIFLLSIKAGLRAKEIANNKWRMVTDGDLNLTDELRLEDIASKGKSGRIISLHRELKEELIAYQQQYPGESDQYILKSERGNKMKAQSIVNFFCRTYQALGFTGCSSHSGRRTFITRLDKNITSVGGSLRDVQRLAGHNSLQTTQRYIEHDIEATMKVMDLI